MTESELREGLAQIIRDGAYDDWKSADIADAALSYLRQHDGHAEFVRAVKTESERLITRDEISSDLSDCDCQCCVRARLLALCDAELAKEPI